MQLKKLLEGIVDCNDGTEFLGLALDSRQVKPGFVFIALSGFRQHGLEFMKQAIAKGAVAIVYDPQGVEDQILGSNENVVFVKVEQLGLHLGLMASRFYDAPSQKMAVIGITGTNGKTSCSQFLSQVMDECGVIGTLGWGRWGDLNDTLNTTPDALAVQTMLFDLQKQGLKTVAMEVSSHGLEQGRVNAVHFKGAVFTNISRDHLDYHGTMESYVSAKLLLLKVPGLVFTVVNLDDQYSAQILAAVPEHLQIWGVSMRGNRVTQGETVTATNIRHTMAGTRVDMKWAELTAEVHIPLYGDFNVENFLTVAAVLLANGVEFNQVAERIKNLQPVPGRMECYGGHDKPRVFVDYAHTPDALEKVLSGLQGHCAHQLWVVFGCGGDRDAGKRPQMGRVAEQWADHVIITDDNPRRESSMAIIKQILQGCRTERVRAIQDRKQAINTAIELADKQDLIVVAGKGHEQYQEVDGIKSPFNDAEIVQSALMRKSLCN